MSDPRSRIPSVDALLASGPIGALVEEYGRVRTLNALRDAIDEVRVLIGQAGSGPEREEWNALVEDAMTYAEAARSRMDEADTPSLRSVINATGVVLHTNLGRAPLPEEAVSAMQAAAGQYTNLEFDLEGGGRGSRYTHCVSLLTELTEAEDALVVNNAAGALVLALNTLALGQGVAVSRGELVEIGGGFRIPEIIERAGARLVEVGSTNRTRPGDYTNVFPTSAPQAILKVHRSNFRMSGFTEEASIQDLAAVATQHGVPLVHDLGSGLMVNADLLGLPVEPRADASLRAGADVVIVSGDKLLGGPQAGILVGKADLIAQMRENPLCRALRVDKVTLAGLEATLRLYRDPGQALTRVPTLALLSADPAELKSRAGSLAQALAESGVKASVVDTQGAVGGGTYPGVELPGSAVEVVPPHGADRMTAALRAGDPPVIGRIVDDVVRFDVRTVLPGQGVDLIRRITEAVLDAGPVPES